MFHAGLDADQFDLAKLGQIKAAHPEIAFCAAYLVAPSHPNAGWMGQHAAVRALGLNTVPVFVGQEVAGPGSHIVTAAQGVLDGQRAAAMMAGEGYPAGSFVYLDLEYPDPESDYLTAWLATVEAAGWGGGVYGSHEIAAEIAQAHPEARIWAFEVPTVERTNWARAPFGAFDPAGCGYAGATLWQHADNVLLTDFNYLVDLDVSTLADPSAP